MNYQEEGSIRHYRVERFEELRELIENQIPDIEEYVFRGQPNANWKLEPTLNRLILHARKTGVKQSSFDRFVAAHLDRFRLEIRGRRATIHRSWAKTTYGHWDSILGSQLHSWIGLNHLT